MRLINIAEVEYVARRLAQELMDWNEPIPDFDTRFPGRLEGCLVAPFQSFNKKFLYSGFILKASVLFYLLIKNHPFQNGNKRIAVATLLYFLHKNDKWLKVDEVELYNFARWVAESNPKLKNETIQATHKFISTYVINIK
ncbi:MAG: type II toxin-antitoxin system death-on-curing family toxin [bacterium]|nr:type II toxin-antitoxin system death-on-curing family toxin [bacterium]